MTRRLMAHRCARGLGSVVSAALFALALGTPVSAAAAPPEKDPESLFYEGSAKYSAADYDGAIDLWTKALTVVTQDGGEYAVRGALLLNLAKAHMSSYEEVEQDIARVRQARAIYRRYVKEAPQAGDAYGDLDAAKEQLARTEEIIAEYEAEKEKEPAPAGPATPGPVTPPPEEPAGPDADEISKARTLGVGLVVSGAALLVGGGVALGYGATFEQFAKDDILKQSPEGHMFTEAEQAHIEDERQKGVVWMAVGGVGAAIGAAGIGVGAWQLNRAKKMKNGQAAWNLSPTYGPASAGLRLSGRF